MLVRPPTNTTTATTTSSPSPHPLVRVRGAAVTAAPAGTGLIASGEQGRGGGGGGVPCISPLALLLLLLLKCGTHGDTWSQTHSPNTHTPDGTAFRGGEQGGQRLCGGVPSPSTLPSPPPKRLLPNTNTTPPHTSPSWGGA